MLIAKSTVQEVHDRLDAIAVVEDYVRLEKRGGRYWGRCPFHSGGQEKTPSFKVEPDQKLYYCFGCHKGGSIIDFVMEMDKVTYPEAIKNLAHKFGVPISYEGGGDEKEYELEQSRKEQLLELYSRTVLSFSHFLLKTPQGKPALDYLLSRKVSIDIIERFRLGYSPTDRNWLYRFLQEKGYSAAFLDESGLFSAHYQGMAFFSGRLMFPIADRQGRVVAFGGRALPGMRTLSGMAQSDGKEPPKYINTREIEIYKKGQILYALDLALPEIRRTKTVYLAEGYMDVIALHQAGITNAVAPCGTAFTDEQAKFLRHWADQVVLVFDSDEAGQQAAIKGIITCRKNNLACSVVVPGAIDGVALKDPGDIFQKFGADTLIQSMKRVIIDLEYFIARGKALYDIAKPKGKAEALAMLYPYLDSLGSKAERDDCIQLIADEMRADNKKAVLDDYERWQRSGGPKKSNGEEVLDTQSTIRMNDELFLLTVVSVNTHLYPEFRASIAMGEIEDPAAKELFITLEECFRNEESGPDALMSRIESAALRSFLIQRGISPEFRGDAKRDPRKLMEDGIKRVKEKRLRRRLAEIGAELRLKERESGIGANGNDAAGDELIAEKMYIDAEIRKLEGKTG
ncbi:MAG: DNA primase [Treponema sp.]|nr:DNA primase [Treponema sp.]